ncbi:MAG TPA: tripartite tricarboxylate transporter TctB family protein [Burkholderiales bacterium]|nr:tripartite tricarboxylate transporter TctB family protein [Burkholderiales bacterium]
MRHAVKEALLGLALLAVGIVALVLIQRPRETVTLGSGGMNYATLPDVYSVLLIGLAVLYLISVLRRARASLPRHSPSEDNAARAAGRLPSHRTVWVRIILSFLALMAYVVMLQFTNFLVITAAYLAAMFWIFGERSLTRIVLVSLIAAALFYGLFVNLLNLPLTP